MFEARFKAKKFYLNFLTLSGAEIFEKILNFGHKWPKSG